MNTKVIFNSEEYNSCSMEDIGKSVVGDTSLVTGILLSYDNINRWWLISGSKLFFYAEVLNITNGGGSGVISNGGVVHIDVQYVAALLEIELFINDPVEVLADMDHPIIEVTVE